MVAIVAIALLFSIGVGDSASATTWTTYYTPDDYTTASGSPSVTWDQWGYTDWANHTTSSVDLKDANIWLRYDSGPDQFTFSITNKVENGNTQYPYTHSSPQYQMYPTQIEWQGFNYPNGDITVSKYPNGWVKNHLRTVHSPWDVLLDHQVTFDNYNGSLLICLETAHGVDNSDPGSSDCPWD